MTSSVLKHQHASLQFSDDRDQQVSDVEKIFKKGKAFPIKTGTESGRETATRKALIECAKDYDHAIKFGRSNFVAVDRAIVKKGTLRSDTVFVVSNAAQFPVLPTRREHQPRTRGGGGPGGGGADPGRRPGHQHDRDFPFISFTHADERLGRISVAGFHYSTKGREKGDPNADTNEMYAAKIAEWMRKQARGTAIALGAGDFNMLDPLQRQDWAFGRNFTSMADELGKYKNTGHGPIDGFVSFDKDGRVKAKKFEVLTDKDLHLFTDHYLCRGTWTVRHLKTN